MDSAAKPSGTQDTSATQAEIEMRRELELATSLLVAPGSRYNPVDLDAPDTVIKPESTPTKTTASLTSEEYAIEKVIAIQRARSACIMPQKGGQVDLSSYTNTGLSEDEIQAINKVIATQRNDDEESVCSIQSVTSPLKSPGTPLKVPAAIIRQPATAQIMKASSSRSDEAIVIDDDDDDVMEISSVAPDSVDVNRSLDSITSDASPNQGSKAPGKSVKLESDDAVSKKKLTPEEIKQMFSCESRAAVERENRRQKMIRRKNKDMTRKSQDEPSRSKPVTNDSRLEVNDSRSVVSEDKSFASESRFVIDDSKSVTSDARSVASTSENSEDGENNGPARRTRSRRGSIRPADECGLPPAKRARQDATKKSKPQTQPQPQSQMQERVKQISVDLRLPKLFPIKMGTDSNSGKNGDTPEKHCDEETTEDIPRITRNEAVAVNKATTKNEVVPKKVLENTHRGNVLVSKVIPTCHGRATSVSQAEVIVSAPAHSTCASPQLTAIAPSVDSAIITTARKVPQHLNLIPTDQLLEELVRRGDLHTCVCGVSYESSSMYFLHRSCHHSVDPKCCNFCSKTFETWFDFHSHFFEIHHSGDVQSE